MWPLWKGCSTSKGVKIHMLRIAAIEGKKRLSLATIIREISRNKILTHGRIKYLTELCCYTGSRRWATWGTLLPQKLRWSIQQSDTARINRTLAKFNPRQQLPGLCSGRDVQAQVYNKAQSTASIPTSTCSNCPHPVLLETVWLQRISKKLHCHRLPMLCSRRNCGHDAHSCAVIMEELCAWCTFLCYDHGRTVCMMHTPVLCSQRNCVHDAHSCAVFTVIFICCTWTPDHWSSPF